MARLPVHQAIQVLTWVLVLAIAVVGVVGYESLGLDSTFPKVDIPTVLVTTTLNGAAPEEIHRD